MAEAMPRLSFAAIENGVGSLASHCDSVLGRGSISAPLRHFIYGLEFTRRLLTTILTVIALAVKREKARRASDKFDSPSAARFF
jgi:hypothetical protein